MKTRRIVMIIGALHPGGAERVACTLSSFWAAVGHEVYLVVTYLDSREIAYWLDPRVKTLFLADRIDRPEGLQSRGFIRKFRALRRLIVEVAPTEVISFLTNVNVLAILACWRLSVPLLISERVAPAADRELAPVLRLASRLLYHRAARLVVQTERIAAAMRSRFGSSVTISVIPNPLPIDLPSRHRRHAAHPAGRVLIGMGRLVQQKRFDILIRAFCEAFARDQRWQLRIIGSGPEETKLRCLADSLPGGDRISLVAATGSPWEEFADAAVFALTSDYEGFPNAMMEAMACGVPCVANDCPTGPRELSCDGTLAVLVTNSNPIAFAQALAKLTNDDDRMTRMADMAAEHVRDRYSTAAIAATWERLMDELSGSTSGPTRLHRTRPPITHEPTAGGKL